MIDSLLYLYENSEESIRRILKNDIKAKPDDHSSNEKSDDDSPLKEKEKEIDNNADVNLPRLNRKPIRIVLENTRLSLNEYPLR